VLFFSRRQPEIHIRNNQFVLEYPGQSVGDNGVLLIPSSGEHATIFRGVRRAENNDLVVLRHLSGSSKLPYLIADAGIIEGDRIVSRKLFFMDTKGNLTKEIQNLSNNVPMLSAQISPDGNFIAYTYMHPPEVPRPILCLLNLHTHESVRLDRSEANSWSRHPSWSPDGKNIAYEKVTIQGRRVITSVWIYSLSHRTSHLVVPISDNAAAAVFLNDIDLAVLNDHGLVLVNRDGKVLATIIPKQQLKDLQYLGSGVAYLSTSRRVAVSFQNRSGKTILFRVNVNGSDLSRTKLNITNVLSIGAL
jgi:Tol biopolymer transport system component